VEGEDRGELYWQGSKEKAQYRRPLLTKGNRSLGRRVEGTGGKEGGGFSEWGDSTSRKKRSSEYKVTGGPLREETKNPKKKKGGVEEDD